MVLSSWSTATAASWSNSFPRLYHHTHYYYTTFKHTVWYRSFKHTVVPKRPRSKSPRLKTDRTEPDKNTPRVLMATCIYNYCHSSIVVVRTVRCRKPERPKKNPRGRWAFPEQLSYMEKQINGVSWRLSAPCCVLHRRYTCNIMREGVFLSRRWRPKSTPTCCCFCFVFFFVVQQTRLFFQSVHTEEAATLTIIILRRTSAA